MISDCIVPRIRKMDKRTRNRREEEDEELMLFLFPALYLMEGERKEQGMLLFYLARRDLKRFLKGMRRTVLSHFVWSLVYSKI
jgi:hypothetical protein